MNNDTPSAVALAQWLEDHPGTPPPPDLDPEVVQAVYALRPELAPAPRLSADDILASVTRGPLADPRVSAESLTGSVEGAEVVPFPHRSPAGEAGTGEVGTGEVREGAGPARRSSRQSRLLRWIGGPGGIGMALVAAATILLVATPILKSDPAQQGGETASTLAPASRDASREEASPAAAAPAAPAGNTEGAASTATGTGLADGQAGFARDLGARGPLPSPDAVSAGEATGGLVGGIADEVITMDGRASPMEQPLIPELQEQLAAEQGVASAEGGVDELNQATAPGVTEAELDTLRAKASRERGNAWRKAVPAEMEAQVEQALKEADALRKAGNPQAAGERLQPLIQAPARMGQAIAAIAGEHYLAAGNADAAVGVAEMGLQLSTAPSPERSQLLVIFGDGLRQLGSAEMAADAYRQAR
jgi:hypothetical protein